MNQNLYSLIPKYLLMTIGYPDTFTPADNAL